MGSLIVKLDQDDRDRIKSKYFYSDIDMLGLRPHVEDRLEVPMEHDVEAVKMSVRNILMWRQGESILRPEFGHGINETMYQQMTQFNKEQVCEEIKRAIEENEPRVEVQTVSAKVIEPDSGESSVTSNTLNVRLVYTVIGNKAEGSKIVQETVVSGR